MSVDISDSLSLILNWMTDATESVSSIQQQQQSGLNEASLDNVLTLQPVCT